jgi:hypothetical protein
MDRKEELLGNISRLRESIAQGELTPEEREYVRQRETGNFKGRPPKRYLELKNKEVRLWIIKSTLQEYEKEYEQLNNYTAQFVGNLMDTLAGMITSPLPLGETRTIPISGDTTLIDFRELMRLLLLHRALIEQGARGRVSIYDYWMDGTNTVINIARLHYFEEYMKDSGVNIEEYDGIVTGDREQTDYKIIPGQSDTSSLNKSFTMRVVLHAYTRPGGRFSRYYCANDSINLSQFQIHHRFYPRSTDPHCLAWSLMQAGLPKISIPTEYFRDDGSIGTDKITSLCASINIGICVRQTYNGKINREYYPRVDGAKKIDGITYYDICRHEDHYMPWYTSHTQDGKHFLGPYNNTLDLVNSLITDGTLQLLPDKYLEQIGKSQYIEGNSLDINATGEVTPYVSDSVNDVFFIPKFHYNPEVSPTNEKLRLLNKYISDPTTHNANEYIECISELGGPSDTEKVLIESITLDTQLVDGIIQEYNTTISSHLLSIDISMIESTDNIKIVETAQVDSIEDMFNFVLCRIPRNKASYSAEEKIELKRMLKTYVEKYLNDPLIIDPDIDVTYKRCYTYFKYQTIGDGYTEDISPDIYQDLSRINIRVTRNSKIMMNRIVSTLVNSQFKIIDIKGNNSKYAYRVMEIMGEDRYRSPISKSHVPIILSNMSNEYVTIVTYLNRCSFSGTISDPRRIKCGYLDVPIVFRSMPKDILADTHEETVGKYIQYVKDIYTITGMSIVDHTSLASLGHDYFLSLGCYSDTKELFSTLRDFIQNSISSNIVGTYNGSTVEGEAITLDFNNAFAASLESLSRARYLPSGKPSLLPELNVLELLRPPYSSHPFWVELNLSNIQIKEMPFPVVKGDQLTENIRMSSISLRDLIEYHELTSEDISKIKFIRGIIFRDTPTDNCDLVIRYLHDCREKEKEKESELSKYYKQLLVQCAYGINGTKPKNTRTYVKPYKGIPEEVLPGIMTKSYRVLPGNKVIITKECHRRHGNVVHRQKLILDNHNYNMRVCIKRVLEAGEKVYYCGVDSLHISPKGADVLAPVIGPSLGQLKIEHEGDGIYVRAGTWCLSEPNGEETYRMSGFPRGQVEENVQKHGSARDMYRFHLQGGQTEYKVGLITKTLKFGAPSLIQTSPSNVHSLGYLFSIACN